LAVTYVKVSSKLCSSFPIILKLYDKNLKASDDEKLSLVQSGYLYLKYPAISYELLVILGYG
jgi:hypothetical protein